MSRRSFCGIIPVFIGALSVAAAVQATEAPSAIKHRFLAMDESRHAAVFVDEYDSSKNWRLEFPARYRDCQLIATNRLLVSTTAGYREYDLATRQVAKEVKDARYAGSETARRMENGHTVLGCNQGGKGIVFHELDASDKLLATASFPKLNTLRVMRCSPRGTLLFGANGNHVIEADLKGAILRDVQIPGGGHIYQVIEKPDGHWLAASGYGQTQVELDRTGKVVKSFGKPGPPELGFHFFGGFQALANGHIVQCNWTGHGSQDSAKGVQIVEFNEAGRIVWQWHHPELAGSIHGVLVLDDSETDQKR